MSPYEAAALHSSMLADRMRDTDHRRLVRQVKQARAGRAPRPVAASPSRHSVIWRLVHIPHAYS